MKKIILSDYKLNLLVDDVTEKLLAARPLKGDAILGSEIVDFCSHKQVGQFVLFRIYQDATQFVGQLNHPHFDFGSNEVKEDLRRFLSTLSRNIKLPKRDFETLLRQAVYNNVKLVLNPEDSITNFFFGNSDSIPIEMYRKHAPYFSDYDFIIRAILAWNEKNQLNRVEREVFLEKFQRVVELYEKKEGKSFGEYQRALFKSLTISDLDSVVAASQPPVIRTETAPSAAFERKVETPAAEVKAEPQREETGKKPLITIRPKEQQPVQPPVAKVEAPEPPKEEKPNIPPWVEQKTPTPPPPAEPVKTVFAPNSAPPRTETPPWVQKEAEPKKQEVILDPVTPLPDDEPVKEQKSAIPVAEEQPEKKTLASTFEQKNRGSLNERFTQKEEKPNLNERSTQEQEKSAEEHRPATILDRFVQSKQEPAREEKPPVEEPKSEIPKVEALAYVPPVEPKAETPPSLMETREVTIPSEIQAPRTVGSLDTETRTLADRFKDNNPQHSVAETIGSKNIRTEHIPVHKQFQYVQKVFGGSSVKFKVILDKINKTQSLTEAEEVLEKYVFNDPNVNRQDKVAKEFEQLVRERFE